MKAVSGTIGKEVVFKQYGDKTVIAARPDMSRRKLTEKQRKSNKKMQMANRYAKAHLRPPEKKQLAAQRLGVPLNRVYVTLVREYMLRDETTD